MPRSAPLANAHGTMEKCGLNLASRKCQKLIGAHLDGVDLLVLDNLSTLVNGGPENDAESSIAMQEWPLDLRRRGITVLIVHHAGRAGNARGTSKREDVLDTVIQLKSPPDYDVSDGARFEVHLTKARGVFGADALPFEAKLQLDDEGRAEWVCSDLGSEGERSSHHGESRVHQGRKGGHSVVP